MSTPIIPPIVGNVIPYPAPVIPFDDVVPFTARSGATFAELFYGLRNHFDNVVIPTLNGDVDELVEKWNNAVNTLVDTVNDAIANNESNVDDKITEINAAFATFETEVTAQLANQNASVAASITAMTTYVDDAVESIINSTIAVSDPVILGVLQTPGSNSANEVTRMIRVESGGIVAVNDTMSAADIQAVLTAIESGTVIFTAGTYVPPVNGYTVGHDGIFIDASKATFESATWGRPVFDLIDRNGITLDIGYAEYVGVRSGVGVGSYRGSQTYVSTSVVWTNGSHNYVRTLKCKGYVTPIFFSSWDGAVLNGLYGDNNRVGKVEVENYNFGILWTGQRDLVIEDLWAHDDLDDSSGTNPTHAYYGSSTTGHRDTRVTILSARCERNVGGNAFQVKYTDQLTITNHTADDCAGVFSAIDCDDMHVTGIRSTNDRSFSTTGSFILQSTNQVSRRPRVSDVFIKLKTGVQTRAYLLISDDGIYESLKCETDHAVGIGSSVAEIDVRGNNNRIISPVIKGIGAAAHGVSFGGAPITDKAIIDNPIFTGVNNIIYITSALVAGVKLNYDPNVQEYSGSVFVATAGADYSTSTVKQAALSTFGDNPGLFPLISGTPVHPLANTGIQVKIRPTSDRIINKLYWESVVANGNYDIAIYDDASGKRLWSKGSTAWPAAGVIAETIAGGLLLRAGKTYRVSFSADNNVGSYRGVNAVFAGIDRMADAGFNATRVAAIFPLPDPLVAGATPSQPIPFINLVS